MQLAPADRFYFDTEDIDTLWEQLEEKTTIVYPIESFYCGMLGFAIRDNKCHCPKSGTRIKGLSPVSPDEGN
jgi:hypothetical protein